MTEWSQAIRTRAILRTENVLLVYCVRQPNFKQGTYWKVPENIRLQLDDMSLAMSPMPGHPAAPNMLLKRWDMMHLTPGEEWREVRLADPQPKAFLWLLTPPRMPELLPDEVRRARQFKILPRPETLKPLPLGLKIPGKASPVGLPPPPLKAPKPSPNQREMLEKARRAGLPPPPRVPENPLMDMFEDVPMSRKSALPARVWMLPDIDEPSSRPTPPVWFLGQMLEQARKLAFEEGKAILVAPFQKSGKMLRFSASLLIVNGTVEWTPPDGESLLIVMDGEAQIPAVDNDSKAARPGTVVSIPLDWDDDIEIKRTSASSFAALLVTVRP
ncbi:MAG: hypothetical protein PHU21_03540 [Elusimicrobia bacterium]|nr:hypothetical protein [Elusimicrobiota bacterium]